MDLIEKIKGNKTAVLEKRQTPHGKPCVHCERVSDHFKLHGFRLRVFLVVALAMVRRVEGALARWLCPFCGRTFTDYPDFALPHKRYVQSEIFSRSQAYLDDPKATYRQQARTEGRATYHAGNEGYDQGRALSHVSLWRWLGWLGRMQEPLRRATALIRERDPASDIHRAVRPVAPHKHQSDERRQRLQAADRLLKAWGLCRRLFGLENFTVFGTG